jgi:hypothetical protein
VLLSYQSAMEGRGGLGIGGDPAFISSEQHTKAVCCSHMHVAFVISCASDI